MAPLAALGGQVEPERPTSPTRLAVATLLSGSAGAWIVGGLFRHPLLPRASSLLGLLVGTGVIWWGSRRDRSPALHYLALPVAAVVGLALVAPAAAGSNVFALVHDALQIGGLRTPPIVFAPGWRFLLVIFFALVGATSSGMAAGFARPKLAVLICAPIAVGAAFLQGKSGSELLTSLVAILLLVAGLAVAYGADLVAQGSAVGLRFELRRLGQGAGMLVALVAVMVTLAHTGFLFPNTHHTSVIPPRKPPPPLAMPDRELMRVTTTSSGPWRIGTLDGYDGTAWLLPSVDPGRVRHVSGGTPFVTVPGPTTSVGFTIENLPGTNLPVPANVLNLTGTSRDLDYDPRTQVPALGTTIPHGFAYTAVAQQPPGPGALDKAPAPPPEIAAGYEAVPSPPSPVLKLLAAAPTDPFERLQYLRTQLYRNVVAAGSGKPVDVTPARVAAMLQPDAPATPYEITAAEALLARWAGVPSRIGYGYFGGTKIPGGYSIRPRDGAAWLEVYFSGHGWVPIIGTPPRAQGSLSNSIKKNDSSVRPVDKLALSVFILYRQPGLMLLFQQLRYWLLVLTPFLLLAAIALAGYPALMKWRRTSIRRRWALRHGARNRILAAYCEFRDRCYDLNLGDVRATPLAFLAAIETDEEHQELAWLVTRSLWGDLLRDTTDVDAAAAEALVASVQRRLLDEQTLVNRVLALISRSSLRDPFNDDVPNVRWWLRPLHADPAERPASRSRSERRGRRRLRAGAASVAAAMSIGGCATSAARAVSPVAFPPSVAPAPPATLLGYQFTAEPSAGQQFAHAGRNSLMPAGVLFSIRRAGAVEGALEVATIAKSLDTSDLPTQARIERALDAVFRVEHIGTARIGVNEGPHVVRFLWFPPEDNALLLFSFRTELGPAAAEAITRAVVAYVRGLPPEQVAAAAADTATTAATVPAQPADAQLPTTPGAM